MVTAKQNQRYQNKLRIRRGRRKKIDNEVITPDMKR